MKIISKIRTLNFFVSIISVCLLSSIFIHECSAHIVDAQGKVRVEVIEVFRIYEPIIRDKTDEIMQKRGLSKEKIQAVLNKRTPISEISLQDLNDIAQVVFLRPAGKERKESQSHYKIFSPYTDKRVYQLFRKIGDINSIYPKNKHYDYVLFNGSTIKNMRDRLKALVDLIKNRKLIITSKTQIVFLTGERDLFPEEKLEQLMDPHPLKVDPRWKKPLEIPTNEYQAAQWIWYQSDLPCSLKNAKIVFVKALKKEEMDPNTQQIILKRPTTFDSVDSWIKDYQPVPGRCISISNQPYVYYQQATIYGAFKQAGLMEEGFKVDGTGLCYKLNNLEHFKENIGIVLDNFARTIYTEVANAKFS